MTMSSSIRLLKTVKVARSFRLDCVMNSLSVGMVPTMGALHAGHCSLVEQSLRDNDITVVSIFVNPSQFAPSEDLNSYPRTLDEDLLKLEQLNVGGKKVNAVFLPTVDEMYPNGIPLQQDKQKGAFVSVLGLSEQLEGVTRPQFFRGVATVVTKLFNVILPTRAYFGAKDIQQTVVVKRMVQDLLLPVEVVVLPTVRDVSGLLLSSRNLYLSEKIVSDASVIYKALHAAELMYQNTTKVSDLLKEVHTCLQPYVDGTKGSFEVEYIKINEPVNLEEVDEIDRKIGAILSCAIKVPKADGGFARLIDNIVLK